MVGTGFHPDHQPGTLGTGDVAVFLLQGADLNPLPGLGVATEGDAGRGPAVVVGYGGDSRHGLPPCEVTQREGRTDGQPCPDIATLGPVFSEGICFHAADLPLCPGWSGAPVFAVSNGGDLPLLGVVSWGERCERRGTMTFAPVGGAGLGAWWDDARPAL